VRSGHGRYEAGGRHRQAGVAVPGSAWKRRMGNAQAGMVLGSPVWRKEAGRKTPRSTQNSLQAEQAEMGSREVQCGSQESFGIPG